LPASVRLVATDLNQPMIDHARAQVDETAEIEWQQADCTAMPFSSGAFSALACQFGLMFVPDKSVALREARRVLADGGLLAFNVWGSLADNPYAQAMQETIAGFFPTDPPTFFDVPFGYHDPQRWSDALTATGFADHECELVSHEARSPTARGVAVGQIQGSPLSHEIRERGGDFDQIIGAVTAALARHGGEAPFRSTMQALVFTARAS
jgi:SAM-dependent methyltransferase